MYRASWGTALLCLLSTAALAQTTNCLSSGNTMNCQTYGGAGNQQSSTANCYAFGNIVSCQQYSPPQVNPSGCGTALGCALQGFERGRQQAQQQRIEQERLEQLRLQNQLLQAQIESQREQFELQRQRSMEGGTDTQEIGNTEFRSEGDEKSVGSAYAPATRTSVLEAEYCFGFGTSAVSMMQYRIHQKGVDSSAADATKSMDAEMLQKRSALNAGLASYIILNSGLEDNASLHRFYNDGMADYGKILKVMDYAAQTCSTGKPGMSQKCQAKIVNPVAVHIGTDICDSLDFLNRPMGGT